jgi:hypothetical protein
MIPIGTNSAFLITFELHGNGRETTGHVAPLAPSKAATAVATISQSLFEIRGCIGAGRDVPKK